MSPAPLARGAALLCLLALSGCGWFSSSTKPTQACPAAVILRPLANTAVFGSGPEARPDNVAFYGLLSEVDRRCDFAEDTVKVNLDVIVIGQRGPAAGQANAVDLTYFIAVTGPHDQIISKRSFPVRITFEPDKIRAGVTDHIVETIPLNGRPTRDITILTGFQQSPQVIDFYKHYRGR